jgi:hypothetical protein
MPKTKRALTQKKRKTGIPKCATKADKSFYFMDIVNVIKHTGIKAATLTELKEGISKISKYSMFHHTCQFFIKGNIQEHTNDFSQWASTNLGERSLAEQLSNIDSYSFSSMDSLRKHILIVINKYLEDYPEPREVLSGEEFFFNEAVTFIFPAGLKARNLAELLMAIKHVDASSIYYHFYEARARLKKSSDDFSKWIEEVHKAPEIASKLRMIDPFMNNLETVRSQIIEVLEDGIKSQMGDVI